MWPFKKKSPQGPVPDNLAEDHRGHGDSSIKAGDMVICINDQWLPGSPEQPRVDETFVVTKIYEGTARFGSWSAHSFYLRLKGKPQDLGWDYTSFRKIIQVKDVMSCDEEFKQTIKRMAPQPIKVTEEDVK